jgi:uncharacterized iron-regulated membrane protein
LSGRSCCISLLACFSQRCYNFVCVVFGILKGGFETICFVATQFINRDLEPEHVMQSTVSQKPEEESRRLYRPVWRWHFYAGVFSIPFIIWLSCTGSIYVFRPQIERWLDRPYAHLQISSERSTPEQIALAAAAAVPHSSGHFYQLPLSRNAAVQVVVGVGTQEYRVYVHPATRAILYTVNEDHRPMTLLAHLHGQLLARKWGSYIVELAASWAIVLLLTGLYLWWPRQTETLAGVLWVRLGKGQRIFWRDLHAVTGVWISALALFLIFTACHGRAVGARTSRRLGR